MMDRAHTKSLHPGDTYMSYKAAHTATHSLYILHADYMGVAHSRGPRLSRLGSSEPRYETGLRLSHT